MKTWKQHLKADPTEWLLEESDPSVRYFTLIDILDKTTGDPAVRDVREKIMLSGTVPKILAEVSPGGYWGKPEDFYMRSKYKGTVWSSITLAELGADGRDTRIRQICEFIMQNSQDPASGAFSYRRSTQGGGDHISVIPCLTGNMVWSLIRFGCLADPRVQKGIDWMLAYQRCDDGVENPPAAWPYDKFKQCWGRHTCHMGVIKMLKALAETPADKRSPEIRRGIEKAAEYFLIHHIYRRSHNLAQTAKADWEEFGFPLMYKTDALEILGVLASLGYHDQRMQDAVDLVVSKQDEQGRWILEETFNGRVLANIERKGKPSKWITLKALTALKTYYTA